MLADDTNLLFNRIYLNVLYCIINIEIANPSDLNEYIKATTSSVEEKNIPISNTNVVLKADHELLIRLEKEQRFWVQ